MPEVLEKPAHEFPEIEDLGDWTDETGDDNGLEPDPDAGRDQPADGQPAAAGDPTAAEKPAASAADPDPAPPAEDAETPLGVDAELAEKAQMWDQWSERYARDPVGFMQAFLQQMSPEQKAVLTGATPEPEPLPFEPQSDAEQHYAKHYKNVETIPQFQKNVEAAFQHRDQFIHEGHIGLAIQEARINALAELLDAKFPDLDRKELDKALQGGKVSYRDAVNSVYKKSLDGTVAAKRQAAKPRPQTPANSSGEALTLPKNASMADIFKAMKRA